MRAIDEKTASKVLQIAATGSTQIQPESAPMGRGSLWLCLGLFVSMMTGIVYVFFRNMSDFPFHWSPTVGLSIAIFFFILAVLRSLTWPEPYDQIGWVMRKFITCKGDGALY
jgi:hypothetical protein